MVTLGSGFEIVENDTFDHVPFACLSPILMPHRLIGRSLAELIMDIQMIKSTVMRQLLDNIYLTNNVRVAAVEGQVNIDDLLNSRAGGIVRVRQPNALQPIQPQLIGQNAFSLLQYLDDLKEQRTGLSKASMGLDADSLQSTTATAVAAQMSAAQGKIEMIARVFAETGVKQLFQLILTLCLHHGKKDQMIRLNNKFVPIDPSNWKHEYDISVNVGLGSGQTNEKMAFLAQMAQKQEQILLQTGVDNPLVSMQQYRNTLAELAGMAGYKDASRFFKNPEDAPTRFILYGLADWNGSETTLKNFTKLIQVDNVKFSRPYQESSFVFENKNCFLTSYHITFFHEDGPKLITLNNIQLYYETDKCICCLGC